MGWREGALVPGPSGPSGFSPSSVDDWDDDGNDDMRAGRERSFTDSGRWTLDAGHPYEESTEQLGLEYPEQAC